MSKKDELKEKRELFKKEISEFHKALTSYKKKVINSESFDTSQEKSVLNINKIIQDGDSLESLKKEFLDKRKEKIRNKKAFKKLQAKMRKYSSNPISRFFSKMRGSWFARDQKYRRSLLNKCASFENSCRTFQEYILSVPEINHAVRNKFYNVIVLTSAQLKGEYKAYYRFKEESAPSYLEDNTPQVKENLPEMDKEDFVLPEDKHKKRTFDVKEFTSLDKDDSSLESNLNDMYVNTPEVISDISSVKDLNELKHNKSFIIVVNSATNISNEYSLYSINAYKGTPFYDYISKIKDFCIKNGSGSDSEYLISTILENFINLVNLDSNPDLYNEVVSDLERIYDFSQKMEKSPSTDSFFEEIIAESLTQQSLKSILSSKYLDALTVDLDSLLSKIEGGLVKESYVSLPELIKESGYLNRLWLKLKNSLSFGDSSALKSDIYEILEIMCDKIDYIMDQLEDPDIDLSSLASDFKEIDVSVLKIRNVLNDFRDAKTTQLGDLSMEVERAHERKPRAR